MAKLNIVQTSFTGGVLSPRVLGHTDVDRYGTGLKKGRNAHPVIHGGWKRRHGTRYVMSALSDIKGRSILVPFIQGRSKRWQVEFGNLTARVIDTDTLAVVATLTTPYADTVLADLDWAQSDADMYLFHPLNPVQRLRHTEDDTWALSPAPFTQVPFSEAGLVGDNAATLSAATVGAGRTLTATTAGYFLAADVGRAITRGAGIAVITAIGGGGTSVTVTITRAFASTSLPAGQWRMDSSPQAEVTPNAVGPVGTSIQLDLGAIEGWRPSDVGSVVRVNGGLVRITSYVSEVNVVGTVLVELVGTTAAPALAWTLEAPVWGEYFGYPRTGTIYQQRLIAAGTKFNPRTVWGSRIAEPLDLTLGTNDDDAFAFTIDGDESSAIAYVSATKGLAVFTESAEYSMRGSLEKPITPTNVRVEPESNHGCASVRPVTVGRETMFVQRAGRKVRAYGYRYSTDGEGYNSPDISALAEHLTRKGVVWMAYQQEPDLLLWAALADGTMVSCTIDRDQQPSIIGWAPHDTQGFVECPSVTPGPVVDEVWCIVQRTINGVPKRYIERSDDLFVPFHPSVLAEEDVEDRDVYGCTVDCGIVFDDATGEDTFSVPHLAGCVVDVLADGSALTQATVAADGALTISRPGKRVLIGLHFDSSGTLLNPEFPTQRGSAQGEKARTGSLQLRVLNTIGGKVQRDSDRPQVLPTNKLGPAVLDQASRARSGLLDPVTIQGWGRDAEITILQDQPYPQHILAAIRGHEVNA